MSNAQEIRMYSRARSRRRTLDVDLNALPPSHEIGEQGVVSHHTRSHGRQEAGRSATALPPPIDVEALDDDVIISSPTAFAEAKNNARRNRGRTVVVDVDNDDRASRNKRRRVPTNQTIINCDLYINLESSSNSSRESGKSAAVPIPPVPPKEPTFSCPICMGPLVEEMTTKCGHIFCKACIKASIAAQGKCPTCRRKTTTRDIIRVYLPSTRTA
ncbi:E3 ubiquitin-protein ligase RNF4-like [Salvia hispanica]|uniref:E3 ubiquitin-protein ligase RNF4-like n=1 Tax=Salvia hispanica TaxID=49212 RepID=UPI002009D369|nr:E3 ubiquitin-protein ligase RNF4-like [Salvia hispanica]XP_047953464.1 E3 ubiquitin-protein ligase RNF4-like [Salvia hispanica]